MSKLPKKAFHEAFAKLAFMLTAKIFERKFQTESNVKKACKGFSSNQINVRENLPRG
jgi:hypothetical protein